MGAGLLGGSNLLAADSSAGESVSGGSDRLLDEIERRACRYFWEQCDPHTGLIRDRARMTGPDGRVVASVAATGFGLSALAVADTRGYLPRRKVRKRVERTLEFLLARAEHNRGFFYHFMDMRDGSRAWRCELSSVDTAWLLCGALHCRAHFATPRIQRLTTELLDRVDWRWMLNGEETLSHGWMPERGFLPYRWDAYSELLAMYLLAIGSATHPISASCWDAWKRPTRTYDGLSYIDSTGALFVHQYSHAWFDFRARRDRYTDYFENSRLATLAHRSFCIELARVFPWFGPDMWGVTASDSKFGYHPFGSLWYPPNGTLAPCAAGGSVAFLPEHCGAVLGNMLERYGKSVWGRYGFVDAFQPDEAWFSPDVIGIDQGIMLLMAENARGGSVWRSVMSTGYAQRGMRAVGLSAA